MTPLTTVLLIDDNDDDNYFHERVLRRSGLVDHILAYEGAQQALDYLLGPDCTKVDAILLDINMPCMNGFEFLDAYTQSAVGQAQIPVLLMITTALNPGDQARAKMFPVVQGCLRKPLDMDKLIEVFDGQA